MDNQLNNEISAALKRGGVKPANKKETMAAIIGVVKKAQRRTGEEQVIEPKKTVNPKPENRTGKFRVSKILAYNWRESLRLFSQIFVIHVEHRLHLDYLVYVGYSDLFEIVPEGVEPPEYDIIINADSTNASGWKITAFKL